MEKGEAIRSEMLKGIIEYIKKYCYGPSIREIGEMVGLKSTASVHSHLYKLQKEGKIETDDKMGAPRAIRIPGYQFVNKDEYENSILIAYRDGMRVGVGMGHRNIQKEEYATQDYAKEKGFSRNYISDNEKCI